MWPLHRRRVLRCGVESAAKEEEEKTHFGVFLELVIKISFFFLHVFDPPTQMQSPLILFAVNKWQGISILTLAHILNEITSISS